jgi:hypothetical protein
MATRFRRIVHPFEKEESSHRNGYLLAFVIGALVGLGLAATWIPEKRRKRLQAGVGEGYRRVRNTGRRLVSDFREEIATSLEAAREELGDMTRQQVNNVRKAVERERKRLGR